MRNTDKRLNCLLNQHRWVICEIWYLILFREFFVSPKSALEIILHGYQTTLALFDHLKNKDMTCDLYFRAGKRYVTGAGIHGFKPS